MRSPEDELDHLREQSLLRQLRVLDSPQSVCVEIDGRQFDNFSSNDYLGLASHPALKQAFHEGIDLHGIGSGASRLVCGTLRPHEELEAALAKLKSTEAALVFSTGYAAASGVICSVMGKDDTIILDKLVHASLVDAARLSGATIRVYPHNDLNKLEKLLRSTAASRPEKTRILVVTESIFSMDGDAAPLAEIVRLKNRHGALLLVDEAHAFGLIGPAGAGLAAKLGLQNDIDFQMGTLSKALGLSGGYIATTQAFRDLLINRARSFIYSTAPSPALAHAATAAVELIQTAEGDQLRAQLRSNIDLLTQKLSLPTAPAAIIPIILGEEDRALSAAESMKVANFLVPAIRYPTVAKGTARLRVTISSAHDVPAIERLAEALTSLP
jgi:8-amino-7-oxononanoate synthase